MFHTLSASLEGTGIGLAIVRKVVQRMHGSLGLESAPGKGSCFWVELPTVAPACVGTPESASAGTC
jgi:signal transduction histidine kinase